MNELPKLIEDYLKQHYCRDYYSSNGESVEDDHYFMYREEVDGLVELIVRECCRSLHPELRDMISRGQGVDAIKQHFGVDE